jgi:deoxyribodipyrimidine photo-lyase
MKALVWFRRDLRIFDNLALYHASLKHSEIIPIYIDDVNLETIPLGGASKAWLHYALKTLNGSLNGNLNFLLGDASNILKELLKNNKIEALYFNKIYEKNYLKIDEQITKELEELGVSVFSYNSSYLNEPGEILKDDNNHYKVFTPYLKKFLKKQHVRSCYNPKKVNYYKVKSSCNLEDFKLLPTVVRWDKKIIKNWIISEIGAEKALDDFVQNNLKSYEENRNFPSLNSSSNLSPYLHFGQISVLRIWHKVSQVSAIEDIDCERFLTEILWRDFFAQILYFYPDLPSKNMKTKFDNFKWEKSSKNLEAWQAGKTGYPIVDAGMQELRQTGIMHNRVRMICGSFLVKNLLIDWREGAAWFWDNLFDADLALNSANWQWVAGSGTDATPYFRIFNPVTQAQRFDPEGEYIKKYIPELKNLPTKYIFEPWKAPENILKSCGIKIGEDYPAPIVDLKESRARALRTYHEIA